MVSENYSEHTWIRPLVTLRARRGLMKKPVILSALVFSWCTHGILVQAQDSAGLQSPRSSQSLHKLALVSSCIGLVVLSGTQDASIRNEIVEDRFWSGYGKKGSFMEQMGGVGSLGVGGGFYLTGLLAGSEKAKKVGVLSTEAWIVNGVATSGLKFMFGRQRPDASKGDPDRFKPFSRGNAFPSGHTSAAFTVATVVSSEYQSPWVSAASYGLAAMVGAERMVEDKHWASDVVAGAMLGYGVGEFIIYWENRTGWSLRLYSGGKGLALERQF